MAELIDRKEIFFTYSKKDKEEYGGDFAGGVLFALDKIDEMPAIEAKPVVHAHWENHNNMVPRQCSNCNGFALSFDIGNYQKEIESDFCPHCGAQMVEEVEE